MAALLQHLKHEEFGPLVAHGSYTMNLCSAKEETRANGLDMLEAEKRICLAISDDAYAKLKENTLGNLGNGGRGV